MYVEACWNVMAHAQKEKTDFVFRRNGRVHLNRWGRQFSRLLAGEVCASAIVMLDTPCSEVVWRVLDTHCIRQFALHFPSRASPCAITFQLDSTTNSVLPVLLLEADSSSGSQQISRDQLRHQHPVLHKDMQLKVCQQHRTSCTQLHGVTLWMT